MHGLCFLSIATSSPRNAEAYLLPGPMAPIRVRNCVLTSQDLGQTFYRGGSTLEVCDILHVTIIGLIISRVILSLTKRDD